MRPVVLEITRAGCCDATNVPKPEVSRSVRIGGEVVGVCCEVMSLRGLVLEGVCD